MEGDKVTITQVYQLVDTKMQQVYDTVNRMENKFDVLSTGRLSNVEAKVASMEGKQMMVPIIISVAISAFGIIVSIALSRP